MASPFSIFRKNQKMMIAVLTRSRDVRFVFLPTVIKLMGGRETADPVVVKDHQVRQPASSDLQALQREHMLVLSPFGIAGEGGEGSHRRRRGGRSSFQTGASRLGRHEQ